MGNGHHHDPPTRPKNHLNQDAHNDREHIDPNRKSRLNWLFHRLYAHVRPRLRRDAIEAMGRALQPDDTSDDDEPDTDDH